MIFLVYGGSGSGKSAYAENLVMKLNSKNKYYLATMKVYGKEGNERVIRHKKLRAGKGFVTIEKETLDLLDAIKYEIPKINSTVLIECVSNLTANEMFKDNRILKPEEVIKKICDDFDRLKNTAENFVVVSNNIFEDGIDYGKNTENYIKALGAINIHLAEIADKVTEVVCGIPLELK